MRKLISFTNVSLDGCYAAANGDLSWAQKESPDAEWRDFVAGNARSGGELMFGRVTYEMMASYWPTSLARQSNPVVAERMNQMPKYVFSHSLTDVHWSNTTLLKGGLAAEVRRLKEQPGPGMAILGSGSLVAQLAPLGLIDEIQWVVNPTVLGAGKRMFEGLKERLNLKLSRTRAFNNGNVLLCFEPAA